MAWGVTPLRIRRGGITPRHVVLFSRQWISLESACRYFKIRQGYLLAHLLSIIALDSVYWVFQAREDIRGVPITSGGRTTKFTISGYADDTDVYLHDRSAVSPVISILDDLDHVSGLWTNRAKSMVPELGPRGSAQPVSTCGLTLLTPGEACRGLGVLVGQQVVVADSWNKCIRSHWSRLVLAQEK